MRHNLTAVFNNRDDAEHVLDVLLVSGYPHSMTGYGAHYELGTS